MDIAPLYDMDTQSVAYTGTAGTLTGWPAGPAGVLVWCTTDAYVIVGDGVTATATNGVPIPLGKSVTINVNDRSRGFTVSAIQITAGGTLYAKPLGGV